MDVAQRERIAALREIEAIAQRLEDRSGAPLRDAMRADIDDLVKSIEEMRKRLIVEAGAGLERVVDRAFFRLVQLLLVCAGLVAIGLLLRVLFLHRRTQRQDSALKTIGELPYAR